MVEKEEENLPVLEKEESEEEGLLLNEDQRALLNSLKGEIKEGIEDQKAIIKAAKGEEDREPIFSRREKNILDIYDEIKQSRADKRLKGEDIEGAEEGEDTIIENVVSEREKIEGTVKELHEKDRIDLDSPLSKKEKKTIKKTLKKEGIDF